MNKTIVLVYPYFKTAAQNLQLFRPLGIAGLASQIKALQLPVRIIDCTFMTFEESIEKIIASNPAIVGMSIMASLSGNAFRLLRELRNHLPETLFVAGGPMPTVFPERFAGTFDLVFRGESDLIFPQFCRNYMRVKNRRNFPHIMDLNMYPGIYLSFDSHSVQNKPVHHPSAVLDKLPPPIFSGFDHKAYQEQWMKIDAGKPITLMSTRGCPFTCDFCSKPVFGNNFRKLSLKRLMREIDAVERFDYNRLWLADDCFTLDETHVRTFCKMLMDRGKTITWSCLSRVKGITPGLAAVMHRAGCIKVYLGLESGSDDTLALMNKNVTVNDAMNTLDILYREGIKAAAFFLVGYPGETRESMEKTFSFALSFPFDEISFNVPYPLPGSPLYDRVKDFSLEGDWEIENETRFLYRAEFDEQWIKARISETLEKFAETKRVKQMKTV